MDERPTTDERLRHGVQAQADRERMCRDVLALEADFTDVQTVRPLGGPDGGADLIATFQRDGQARGAVGFKSSANDSDEQRREVSKKFRDDLKKALAAEPNLTAFAFFTNVDLPPSDVKALERHASNQGVDTVRIFHRERLREVLDSPSGFFVRLRYLKLPMTEAEQLAFFERYGSDLTSIIQGGFEELGGRLDSVEFTAASSKRLSSIDFLVHLKRPRTLDQLQMCGVAIFSLRPDSATNPNTLTLAYVSQLELGAAPMQAPGDRRPPRPADPMLLRYTGRQVAWYMEPGQGSGSPTMTELQNAVDERVFLDVLWTTAFVSDRGPLKTLADFDTRHYTLWLTQSLLQEVQEFSFCVNEYRLFRLPLAAFDVELLPLEATRDFAGWHPAVTAHLREQQWVQLSLRRSGGGYFYNVMGPGALTTDFASYTPSKFVNRPYGGPAPPPTNI